MASRDHTASGDEITPAPRTLTPASRFLRPCAGRLAAFHPFHIATIKRGMTTAARDGKGYHLWWHPHNFGQNLEANLEGLSQIIRHFMEVRDRYGMSSLAMKDFGGSKN